MKDTNILVFPVPEGWTLYTANEIKSKEPHSCVSGPFGSKISSKYFSENGIPIIRGSNLRDDLTKFIDDGFVFVSEMKANEFKPQLALANDLIFTCWGTVGQVGIVPENGKFKEYIISNKQLKLRVDKSVALPMFCYYYFSSKNYVKNIRNRSIGGAVPGINLGILKSLTIALPTLATQNRIVDALLAYDDLIENNQRRMALLEESARLVYHEWFVHFRFPGREHVKFVDGLPEGWKKRRLVDCVTFQSGGTPKKSKPEYWSGNVPWISSGELTTMRVSASRYCVTHDAVRDGSRYAEKDTILVVVRGMSLAKEFRMGVVSRRVCFNQDVKAFVPDQGIPGLFIFHALFDRREQIRQRASEAAHGTKKLETSILENISITVPPSMLVDHFVDLVRPMHEQWDCLFSQNQKLAQARDLLLPRLMSGQISV